MMSGYQNGAPASPVPRPAGQVPVVLLTAVAFFMVVLDALVVVTALPSIHRSLGGSLGTLQSPRRSAPRSSCRRRSTLPRS
jgi:hypothetical protein